MNKPVRTVTPGGEEIVILPVAEYERLLELAEDSRDRAIADEALAEHRASVAETLTQEGMLELLDASSPIAFWRKRRGLTQSALASEVGVTQAYLAQIEKGRRTGDIRLYRKLADALGIAIERIEPPARAQSSRRSKAKA